MRFLVAIHYINTMQERVAKVYDTFDSPVRLAPPIQVKEKQENQKQNNENHKQEIQENIKEIKHNTENAKSLLQFRRNIRKELKLKRKEAIAQLLNRLEPELVLLIRKRYSNDEILQILNRALRNDDFRKQYEVPNQIQRLRENHLRKKLKVLRKAIAKKETAII